MSMPEGRPPLVSVLIPCRDEAAFIGPCLRSICANEYPADRLEILVLDGGSLDETRRIVAEQAAQSGTSAVFKLIANPQRTIPAAMNLGVRESHGDIILKVDAHSTYPRTYISQCVEALLSTNAEMTGGVIVITPRNDTRMARSIALGLSHPFASGNAYVKVGSTEPRWADAAAFGCWRRSVLEKLGPFDERLIGSSDMDMNIRLREAGGKILLVPDIRITYYADADLLNFWRHNFSDGLWTTYALKFGKRASAWRHWVPLLFVVALGAWMPLQAVVPPAGGVLSGGFLLYGLITLAATLQICRQAREWRLAAYLPVVFAMRHVAHGLGALYGALLALTPGSAWRGRRAAATPQEDRWKRVFDVTASLIGLVLLWPVFAVLGLLIRADSPGPVFYRGERLGRYGKPFHMVKFRTMYRDSGQSCAPITPDDDPRVTRVGALLRRFKLDELPQLINVVRGDMSLVGPRPEAPYYFRFYTANETQRILSVRPGMTDYGSLRFHNEGELLAGDPDPVKGYVERIRSEKVREQLRYIRERSLLVDIKIIVRTIMTLLVTRCRRVRLPQQEASSGT